MKVLLTVTDLYSSGNNISTFFKHLIEACSDHEFFYLTADAVEPSILPANVRALPLLNLYRSSGRVLRLDNIPPAGGDTSVAGRETDLLLLFDMAASVSDCTFDVVDIPDFLPLGALLPMALRQAGVTVDRVALSMSGAAAVLAHDSGHGREDISQWQFGGFDGLLYRSVDLRYGIDPVQLAEWEANTGQGGHLLDPCTIIDRRSLRRLRGLDIGPTPFKTRPKLVHVSRDWEDGGPGLFIELVATLPPAAHSGSVIVRNPASADRAETERALVQMAARRRMDVEFVDLSREQLREYLASHYCIGIVSSPVDVFEFDGIDSLLSGTPTMLSGRAAAAVLGQALPDIPHLKLDCNDLLAAQENLITLIDDYAGARDRLNRYLDTAELRPCGRSLDAIYRVQPTPDLGAQQSLATLFNAVAREIETAVASGASAALRQTLLNDGDGVSAGNPIALAKHDPAPARSPSRETLVGLFDHFTQLQAAVARVEQWRGNDQGFDDTAFTALSDQLAPLCFSGMRIPLYRLLAEIEDRRGNDLLCATYGLRVLRLSGRHDAQMLDKVCKNLAGHGFDDEADVARMLYGQTVDFAAAAAYLDRAEERFRLPPTAVAMRTIDRRSSDQPKISIVVSLYNAADKLPIFLSGVAELMREPRPAAELILVDSNSTDCTYELVRDLLDDTRRYAEVGRRVLYVRTPERETIQRAWNRGIALARGSYLALLGADEMNRPDTFEILADYLDRNPTVDWVQGTANVTQVNQAGSFVRDVMSYNRYFDTHSVHYLDCCYIGYVGGLYRRSVHDRVGFYDDRFRAAGDVEFKHRALPRIRVVTLPQCLGFFRNYPEERTTESPTAEIEDVRAWYLHRSVPGLAHAFDDKDPAEAADLLKRCLGYRKTYMDIDCTDLDLADAVGQYLAKRADWDSVRSMPVWTEARKALDLYRAVDGAKLQQNELCGIPALLRVAKIIADADVQLPIMARDLAGTGVPIELILRNDNRYHQHHTIWKSRSTVVVRPSMAGNREANNNRTNNNRAVEIVSDDAARTPNVPQPKKRSWLTLRFSARNRPQGIERFIADGDEFRDRRDWAAAAVAYRQALDADPGRAGIWVQLGHALKEQGDTLGGEEAYRASLEIDDSLADTYLQLGHVLKLRGQLTEAADAYLRALALDGDVPDARQELTLLGYTVGELDVAAATGILSRAAAKTGAGSGGHGNPARQAPVGSVTRSK